MKNISKAIRTPHLITILSLGAYAFFPVLPMQAQEPRSAGGAPSSKSTSTEASDHAATEASRSSEREAVVKAAAAKVQARLHMPAMLMADEDPSMDADINELYESGWIIEATVEQVEKALAAAASTPDLEDDRQARILAHRASCRYFFKP